MSTSADFQPRLSPRTAFTLVELLVVIGILAVLISLLLSVAGGVRKQARVVQCASKLRAIGQASIAHAAAHEGHLPLAGRIVIPMQPTPIHMPMALGDNRLSRYTYAHVPDPGSPLKSNVVPFIAALAPYLGITNLPKSDWAELDRVLNSKDGAWKHFMCPDGDALDKQLASDGINHEGQGTMMAAVLDPSTVSIWSTNADYVANEGLLGYHYDGRYSRNRLAGKLSKLSQPAEIVLFTDGRPRDSAADALLSNGWMTWTPSLDDTGPATLGQALAGSPRVSAADNFAKDRHGGRLSAVFADGHVETIPITREALDQVYLLKP